MVSSRRSAISLGLFNPSSTNSIGVILLFWQNLPSFRSLTSAATRLLLDWLSYQRLTSWFSRRISLFVGLFRFCLAVIIVCSLPCINFFPTSDRTSMRSSSAIESGFIIFTLFISLQDFGIQSELA